jgi:hypothetical protein
MDLSQFDTATQADKGSFLHLESPDGRLLYTEEDPKQPIGITVLGADSKIIVAERHRQENRNTDKIRIRAGGKVKTSSAEEREESVLAIAARACAKFHNVRLDTVVVPDTFQGAFQLLERLPWVRDQVTAHMEDRANYMGE